MVVSPVCSASLVWVFYLSTLGDSWSGSYAGYCYYCSSLLATSAAALSTAASSAYWVWACCSWSLFVLLMISASSFYSEFLDSTCDSLLSLVALGFGFYFWVCFLAGYFFGADGSLFWAALSICFDCFFWMKSDFLSSTPEEKNLSILTMFFRNPHCAYDLASTSACAFWCTWLLASSLFVVWTAAFCPICTYVWASWLSSGKSCS